MQNLFVNKLTLEHLTFWMQMCSLRLLDHTSNRRTHS